METKVKILDGIVESTNTDNHDDVILIYTKLNFERFVDKTNKLCKGYKQHLTDLMGSIKDAEGELNKWQDRCDNLIAQGKELNAGGMLVSQVREKKYRLNNLVEYYGSVLNLIPKLDELYDTLKTYQYVDELKKDSPKAKIKLKINKIFAKDIHNNLKNPEVHIATDANGEYSGLVGYVSH